MNQETLPVLNPQVLHLTSYQSILLQLHILHKVTLTVETPTLSHVPGPTEMFQKYLHKAQMAFPVVSARLTYAPVTLLLHLESLKMLLQEANSVYPNYIPD